MTTRRMVEQRAYGLVFLLFWLGSCGQSDRKLPEAGDSDQQSGPSTTSRLEQLEKTTYIDPLTDAYSRIDPARDGWESEVFHEETALKLEELTQWLSTSAESEPPAIINERFLSSPWIPSDLAVVFQSAELVIKRAQPAADKQVLKTPLRQQAASFRSAFGPNGFRMKLKPFRVIRQEESTISHVRLEAFGESSTDKGLRQVTSEWSIHWNAGPTPLMESIEVVSYEEIASNDGRTRFQDHTAHAFTESASLPALVTHGTDHWRARLPRNLGLDVVGNHGLAMGDVNGDRLDDLYVCLQGGLPNQLYLRQPDGTLLDYSRESGADWLDYSSSALIADFDNDGHRDLVVGLEWRLLFMQNDGSGRFRLAFGTSTRGQTYSLAVADADQDGDLDLYACGYNPPAGSVRQGVMGEPVPFHDAQNGGQNMFLRNDGNWDFQDVTDAVGLGHNNNRFSFAAAWEDYDNDGDLDLYVANDYGRNHLYRQENGNFTDVADRLGVEDTSSGMSVSWGDYNRDGRMDVYVGNMFSSAGGRLAHQDQFHRGQGESVRRLYQRMARGNTLFESLSDEGFYDRSLDAQVQMGRWAWASPFVDINNDGWQDLLVANGYITTEDTGDL